MAWHKNLSLLLCCSLLLGACATRLTPEQAALRSVTPALAASQPALYQGRQVEWGGMLIATHNRRNHTLIEVLAYPLRNDGRPDLGRPPLGRFLAIRQGYLEPLEFAAGRRLTVTGPLSGTRRGRVGDGEYLYPTLDARQLRLWPRQAKGRDPRLHFGVGVGSGGAGWGAGVGF